MCTVMQRFLVSQCTSSLNVCMPCHYCLRETSFCFALVSFIRSRHVAVQQSCDRSLEISWLTCFDVLKLPGIRLFISTQHIPMQSPRLDTFVATVEPPKKVSMDEDGQYYSSQGTLDRVSVYSDILRLPAPIEVLVI
jgi:hypothetical protein